VWFSFLGVVEILLRCGGLARDGAQSGRFGEFEKNETRSEFLKLISKNLH
jgi:hypothetical protein